MKQVAILLLLAMTLMVGGCGSTPTSVQTGAGGIWLAELSGGTGEASGFSFITQFTLNGNATLNITSFQFLTVNGGSSDCFPINGGTVSGSIPLTLQSNDTVTGTITYTVTDGGNTLTLTGNVVGTATESGGGTNATYTLTSATITGNWSLKGSGNCSATGGSFSMTQS
jgi:hypothetical protein